MFMTLVYYRYSIMLKTVCPQGRVGSNPTLSAQTAVCVHAAVSMSVFIKKPACQILQQQGKKMKKIEKSTGQAVGNRVY